MIAELVASRFADAAAAWRRYIGRAHMTVIADWRWWTYFLVDGELISSGRIVEYDFETRAVKYLRSTERSYRDNPHPRGSSAYDAWLYDTVHSRFDHVWVDTEKRIALSSLDRHTMERGATPSAFLELVDQDPQAYFGGVVDPLSSYLPSSDT